MAFPPTVQREMGYALFLAQMGERHSTMAKTLGGFGGATVIEVRESYDGNAYRRFTRYATPTQSTCFTRSRRNQRRASRRPR
jgi:phage-related protein